MPPVTTNAPVLPADPAVVLFVILVTPAIPTVPPKLEAPVPTVKIFVPVTNNVPLNVFTEPLNCEIPETVNEPASVAVVPT